MPELWTFAVMMRFISTLTILAALLIISCGRRADVPWQNGNFKVYAIDTDFNATMLGYDHKPGLLGLVDAKVVAAGSSADSVFVERIDRTSGKREFYIVRKDNPSSHLGKVEGPLTETEFREVRTARRLPEFTWKKK